VRRADGRHRERRPWRAGGDPGERAAALASGRRPWRAGGGPGVSSRNVVGGVAVELTDRPSSRRDSQSGKFLHHGIRAARRPTELAPFFDDRLPQQKELVSEAYLLNRTAGQHAMRQCTFLVVQ
jgi:hypothetical protein